MQPISSSVNKKAVASIASVLFFRSIPISKDKLFIQAIKLLITHRDVVLLQILILGFIHFNKLFYEASFMTLSTKLSIV